MPISSPCHSLRSPNHTITLPPISSPLILTGLLTYLPLLSFSAIFCGSASSLKYFIQTRFPNFFGSSAASSHKNKSKRSRGGPVFALETFGGTPMTPTMHGTGTYGDKNTTSTSQRYADLDSTPSQEAIVVKKDFWVDVSDGEGPEGGEVEEA